MAEREVAAQMLPYAAGDTQGKTVAADKAYDTKGFVMARRDLNVTPHVAQNINRLTAAPSTGASSGMRAMR